MAVRENEDARGPADRLLRHTDRVFNYLFFRVQRRREDAHDLCQDTLLRAFRSASAPDDVDECYLWLCGIARNVLREYYRRQRKVSEGMRELEARARVCSPDGNVPEDNRDDATAHWTALTLSALPPSYREVLRGKYCDGLSTQALAANLRKSEHAVESLLSRARDAFRNAWRQTLHEDY